MKMSHMNFQLFVERMIQREGFCERPNSIRLKSGKKVSVSIVVTKVDVLLNLLKSNPPSDVEL